MKRFLFCCISETNSPAQKPAKLAQGGVDNAQPLTPPKHRGMAEMLSKRAFHNPYQAEYRRGRREIKTLPPISENQTGANLDQMASPSLHSNPLIFEGFSLALASATDDAPSSHKRKVRYR